MLIPLFKLSVHEVVSFIIISQIKLSCFLCRLVSYPQLQGWGASCPGRFILPPPPHLGIESYIFSCSFHLFQISEYEVDSFITIIQVKLSCCLCCLISLTFVAGVGGGGASCPGQFILPPTWV